MLVPDCVVLCKLDVFLCFACDLLCVVVWCVVFLCVCFPKRTCSVGCTIQGSNDKCNVYGKKVTTIWGPNLGAIFGVQAAPLPKHAFV